EHAARLSAAPVRAEAAAAAHPAAGSAEAEWPPRKLEERTSLGDLLDAPDSASIRLPDAPRIVVDEARAAAAGVRKLAGRRLTLFTDLPPSPEVESLPAAFDQAFPQWCEYLAIQPAEHADWSMTGFLIQDKARFRQLGLLPDYLPPFEHGFSLNHEFWVFEQPSGYYRRHLVLHEGTHGFMNTILGACGPPWFMEGTAELLATHRFNDGRLELRTMPASRDETPMWGRIKIIKDAYAAGEAWPIRRVIEDANDGEFGTEPYAWNWGLATLLDGHPAYRQRFRQLRDHVTDPRLNDHFHRLFADDWAGLSDHWQVFVADLEYGYDVARNAIVFTPGKPLPAEGAQVRVAADRGWQNSGLRLEAGKTYRLRASGRYQLGDRPRTWWCEPGGVSIRYYHGLPLGILLAAVRPDEGAADGPTPLVRPLAVGLGADLKPEQSGTLYLRINDSGAELADNAGEATVEIARTAAAPQ
ncbi:MAG: hypothetical protein HUU20_12575, partial [Pirellulales bacterium]|nr:hypothetical protein [Pirellulales bacterium]